MSRITIVTVCLNEGKTIQRTIESVLNQTFTDYEYIIKDGNSSDDSNEVIESYRNNFEKKGIRFVHLTGNDCGIYNAMNIAARNADGEWINFMNAGDSFYNETVLFDVFYNRTWEKEGILYGHTLCEIEHGGRFVQINDHRNLMSGEGISQQVCFIRRDLIEKNPFVEEYKILGDFDFLVKMLSMQVKFAALNVIVANYNREGISSRKLYIATCERNRILKNYIHIKELKCRDKIVLKMKERFINCVPLLSDYLFCIHRIRRNDYMGKGGGSQRYNNML